MTELKVIPDLKIVKHNNVDLTVVKTKESKKVKLLRILLEHPEGISARGVASIYYNREFITITERNNVSCILGEFYKRKGVNRVRSDQGYVFYPNDKSEKLLEFMNTDKQYYYKDLEL